MALAPWKVVGGGKIRTDEEEEKRRETGEKGRTMGTGGSEWERNEEEKKVCKALEKVAAEVGAKHITSGIFSSKAQSLYKLAECFVKVAIAYVMQKTPYVFPVIGGRKVEHLMANLEALEISLSDEHIKYLESVVPFDPGFPNWMIVSYAFFFLLQW